jgi:signal transduction histidine kinase
LRLGTRILLFFVLTCIGPLLVLALASNRVTGRSLFQQASDTQAQLARALAADTSRVLADRERVLGIQLATFRLETASDEVRMGFLRATWRLFPEITIAVLVDDAGEPVGSMMYQLAGDTPPFPDHDVASQERLTRFRQELPAAPGPGLLARGLPYVPPDRDVAVLPLIFGSPESPALSLGVELSLQTVRDRMVDAAGESRLILLLDEEGFPIVRAGDVDLLSPAAFAAFLESGAAELTIEDRTLANVVRVPGMEWNVAVAEPLAAAQAAVGEITRRTGFIAVASLLATIVLGLILTRSVTQPLGDLREAAQRVGQGQFARVAPEGQDELADLGNSFNRMSASLEANAREIAEKNAEIADLNRGLQKRVEEQTRKLREAQSRLVESGQLAAVAEMSAGLAHELNNPLAGLLGLVQLVADSRKGSGEEALLRAAEEQALRCRDIVANLLRLTSAPTPEARDTLDLDAVLRDVLALVAGPIRQRGVLIVHEKPAEDLLILGEPQTLARALGQLLTSLRAVSREGATLTIAGSREGSSVRVRFGLSATALSPDDWRAAAMGFWVARRMFRDHAMSLSEEGGDQTGLPRWWCLEAPVA